MERNRILQNKSSLDRWLSHLKNLHSKNIDMELTRVSQVAKFLDILKPAPLVFTVAGTNGKGTTCHTLEVMLIAAGYRVGVYSSPHLVRYTERVRVQNTELPESDHTATFNKIERARGDISLTYFEYSTLSALLLFKEAMLDVVILEVGLGGRLDATNMVDADVSVVTNIAIDHTDWLGPDRESIAREKVGILRAGKPAVIADPDIPNSISTVVKEKGSHLLLFGVDWNYKNLSANGNWFFSDTKGKLNNLPRSKVPQSSAATAIAALRASGIKVNDQSIRNGIQSATLPGRFQIINESPKVILDVAHNPHAVSYLASQLASLPKVGRLLAVIGMLYDKDISGTIACIESLVDYWYCASLKETRGASAEQILKYLIRNSAEGHHSVEEAWKAAVFDARSKDTILVFGSFHTVAHVINIVKNQWKINF